MTFAEELARMPFAPAGTNATGFTAPLMRASGHALFIVIGAAVGTEVVSEEEILTELREIRSHLNDTDATNQVFSTAIKDRIATLGAIVDAAIEEYPTWTDENRKDNLQELANRFPLLGVDLDRELAGLTTSDAGRQF